MPSNHMNKPTNLNHHKESILLANKEYHARSLTLNTILNAAVMPYHHNTTNFTLFCPQDHAFFKSKHPQPLLMLLK
ncbi:hypothetical protein DVH24_006955 [Malus domestica]|uniref:FAS1 domain-containing protein n=1 Tax=Malus domestica TaxID=3750 RepID=A0A498IAA0_MALDO|nr:hypothetical protein DVH24_006955 [Malus domestica]